MANKNKDDDKMKRYVRGSEWRRWDLHVHTPSSTLENKFPDWDSYVAAVENAGVGVSVLGATDYCSIDGYRKLLEYRKDGRLAAFDLILPNLEFRIQPQTSTGQAINVHLLISPDDPNHLEEIEQALAKLTTSYAGKEYCCSRVDLIRFGKAHDPKQKDDHAAFRHGVNQFKPSFHNFREWYQNQGWLQRNSIVVMSNRQDGPGGLSKDAGFSAEREELYRFSHAIFSGSPADRAYFLGEGVDDKSEVIRKNGSLKPCIHGSDAHVIAKLFAPDGKRYCWIKADPTFEGLRQILHEPSDRVVIGPTPPESFDDSKVIDSIELHAPKWFPAPKVELNAGLVTIIGEKGSGKTALAELIAFGSHSWKEEESTTSFITKAQPFLSDAKVTVNWRDGSTKTVALDDAAGVELPLVRYLSQDFVEQLCSQDTSGRELIREIENVVFSHIPETDRLDASSFEELRRLKTEGVIARRNALVAALSKLNLEIVALEDQVESKKGKQTLLKKAQDDISAIDKQLPALQSTVDKKVANELAQEKVALQARNKELSEVNKLISRLGTARSKIEDIQEAITDDFKDLRPILVELGLTELQIEKFRPTFPANFDKPLGAKEKELNAKNASLRGDPKKPQPDGSSIADIQVRIVGLEKKLAADSKQRERLLGLQRQRAKLERERDRFTKEIEEIDSKRSKMLDGKREDRWKAYLSYFDQLQKEAEVLEALYGPLSYVLANDSTGAKAGFELSVRRVPKIEEWVERGKALVDRRRLSPLAKDRDFSKRIKDELMSPWATGDEDAIRQRLAQVLGEFESGSTGIGGVLDSHATKVQFYDWFFSPDHITIDYTLRYHGKELNVLSPGTRGIVLLILYLEMDREDRRPLVIDQPEGNLDSSSIYDSLVPYLRRAKKDRQIVLVTHNPNLVVATDADQVIVAEATKDASREHPEIRYRAGALEEAGYQLSIRERVCRLLEGGRDAFKARENRYAISEP